MKKTKLFHIALAAAIFGAVSPMSAQNTENVETVAVEEAVQYFPNTDADSRLNGEWNIDNVNGQKVTGEERPMLNFDLAQGKLYGNNGCNVINANIVTGKDNRMHFTDMLATRMYCADAPFEYIINTTLGQVRSYKISRYGHDYYLDLFNERGHIVMVLRKHNMDFLNGAWQVTAIDGKPNSNEAIQFVIDLPEKKLHGNAGCNIVNGEITVDPDVTNSVQFSNLATTRMMCPDLSTETAVLVALEETEKAFAKSDDNVTFVNHAGQPVLSLSRIDPATLADN